jgi:hypothetical protein
MRASWRAPLGWLLVALLVRGLTALALPHPGYIDATYALHVAAGLLAGQGLTEEVVWNHLWTSPTLPRPSNAYWPPGPALFAAAGGFLLPDGLPLWRRAQALPVLGSALLVAGTYVLARRLSARRSTLAGALPEGPPSSVRGATPPGPPSPAAAHLAAGIVLGSGAYFPYWVTTDSFTPFALAAGGSLWLAVEAHNRAGAGDANTRRARAGVGCCLLGAGALAGLAQWVRADGLLFLVAPLLAALAGPEAGGWAGRARRALPGVALVLAGAALTAGPLALRAVLTWGTPAPPGMGGALWLTAYDDLFRFGQAPTFGRWLAAGPAPAATVRGAALLANLAALGQSLLYVALPLAALGAWRWRLPGPHTQRVPGSSEQRGPRPSRGSAATDLGWGAACERPRKGWVEAGVALPLAALLTLYGLHSLVFPFQGVRGALFHALAALVPWLALWAAWGLLLVISWGAARRGWRESQARPILGGALATLLLLGGVSFTVDLRRRWEPHAQAYRVAGAWLDAHAPPEARLMGVDPPGLWYATGRIVVATPSDGPQALLRAAATYGVDYVLVQPFSPPYLAPLYDDQAPLPGLQHVADAAHLRLYRVVSTASGPSGALEGLSQTEMESVSPGGRAASSSAAVEPRRG